MLDEKKDKKVKFFPRLMLIGNRITVPGEGGKTKVSNKRDEFTVMER